MPTALRTDSIGPIDVALIRFDGNRFNGDVAPALAELSESGTIRIIDLAFVLKEVDGQVSFVEVDDPEVSALLTSINGEQFDLLSDDDLVGMAEALEPGSSALVVVWEHTWAARFAAAVRASKGFLVAQERIPRENVMRAIAALDED